MSDCIVNGPTSLERATEPEPWWAPRLPPHPESVLGGAEGEAEGREAARHPRDEADSDAR